MRAKNMQALTNDIKAEHPGVTVYGIGDEAHKRRTSDHNEDDTPGSRAPQFDADSTPEHRAIDVMLGSAFNRTQAYALINYILSQPNLLKRLRYINFENWQWSKSNGWARRDNSDDPHFTHVHFSGDAADDENGMPWLRKGNNMFCQHGDSNGNVVVLQAEINKVLTSQNKTPLLVTDGNYGDKTATALLSIGCGNSANSGQIYGAGEYLCLTEKLRVLTAQQELAAHLSTPHSGEKGDPGDPGKTPSRVELDFTGVKVPAVVTEYLP